MVSVFSAWKEGREHVCVMYALESVPVYSQHLFRGVLLCLSSDSHVCAQKCVCRF